jgi:hypothetical protein
MDPLGDGRDARPSSLQTPESQGKLHRSPPLKAVIALAMRLRHAFFSAQAINRRDWDDLISQVINLDILITPSAR